MSERQQAKKIVDELLNYFFFHKIDEVKIALDFAEDGLYIEMQGKVAMVPGDLEQFATALNSPRDLTMEDYSEHLIGSEHHDREDYHLLGTLIDDVEIMYDRPLLDIKVFRKIDFD